VRPDLTLLLDLPVAAGRARAAGRGDADRIEAEADAFFERVRASYRARAAQEPQRFRVLDASQAPEQVLQAATRVLTEWLEGSTG
jgi:dTMP kinase